MPARAVLQFRCPASSVVVGFYFHSSDEDLSLGSTVEKKPLGGMVSEYISWGNSYRFDRERTRNHIDSHQKYGTYVFYVARVQYFSV
jgi:hypothetical protein